jgi:hypothetical protein
MTSMAVFAFYSAAVVGAGLVSAGLLWRYVDRQRVSMLILIVTWYAWLTSFSVIALVPLDVYVTLSGKGSVSTVALLWSISYWSTQLLTWAAIPILQNYCISGSFTVIGRFKEAFQRLWRFYLIIGSLAAVGIIVAAVTGHLFLGTLPQLVVALSNAYGLIAVVVLLGYGLVEVPRVLWRRSFPEERLQWHFHRVGRAARRMEDASKELERCLVVVIVTSQQVARSDVHLRAKADALVAYVDATSPVPLAAVSSRKIDVEGLEERDLDYATDAGGLARLRGRTKLAIAEYVGSRGDYSHFLSKAVELDVMCKARQTQMYAPPKATSSKAAGIASAILWRYKCLARPTLQRLGSIVAAAASATIVWSEVTIGSGRHPDLSPFSIAIHSSSHDVSPWALQFLVAAPLAFVSAATYFSLFKLGSLGNYHMVKRSTWSWSLLLNGSLLARFAAPLAYNYLHVIRMTGGQRGGRRLVFVNQFGMEDVPLLGTGFNTWFPLLIGVYVAALMCCQTCAAKLLLSARLRFDAERCDEENTSKGQRLVEMERRSLESGHYQGEVAQLFGRNEVMSDASGSGALQPVSGPDRHLELIERNAEADLRPNALRTMHTGRNPSHMASPVPSLDAADRLFERVERGR